MLHRHLSSVPTPANACVTKSIKSHCSLVKFLTDKWSRDFMVSQSSQSLSTSKMPEFPTLPGISIQKREGNQGKIPFWSHFDRIFYWKARGSVGNYQASTSGWRPPARPILAPSAENNLAHTILYHFKYISYIHCIVICISCIPVYDFQDKVNGPFNNKSVMFR